MTVVLPEEAKTCDDDGQSTSSSVAASRNDDSNRVADNDWCAVGELSSHSSIESGDNGHTDIDHVGMPTTTTSANSSSVQIVMPSSPSFPAGVQKFWNLSQQNPSLRIASQEFRNNRSANNRRLETPSAAAAMENARALRRDYAQVVVQSGTLEDEASWKKLAPDHQDEFLTHLFLVSR